MALFNFSDIGEQLRVPNKVVSKYKEYYQGVYDYCIRNYKDTRVFKTHVVNVLNTLLYYLLTDGDVPVNWQDMLTSGKVDDAVPSDVLEHTLGDLYIAIPDVVFDRDRWIIPDDVILPGDVGDMNTLEEAAIGYTKVEPKHNITKKEPEKKLESVGSSRVYDYVSRYNSVQVTPKEDLFITFPEYPRVGKRYSDSAGNIRISLPKVPRRQRDISLTTDVNDMSVQDLMNLYPRQFIQTRSASMYIPRHGITMDPDYGLLIPVQGFTDAQVRDSIIRYPHIFRLKRIVDGKEENFYSKIEIDGELLPILDVWKYLPESRVLSLDNMQSANEQMEFIKEYAIRRYLLERDIKNIDHRYPISGHLGEFITLFMPPEQYKREGYSNVVDLARMCVVNRSNYISSRNPRIKDDCTFEDDCMFSSFCTSATCDMSCPSWAQSTYLLRRNDLSMDSDIFRLSDSELDRYVNIYNSCNNHGLTVLIESKDEIRISKILAYIAICKHWRGNVNRCDAYHLRFSKYLTVLQRSWNYNEVNDEIRYMQSWVSNAKMLIVSDFSYVNLKDFQSQTLLQLIYDREIKELPTIIVSPRVENLIGSGDMFHLLKSQLKQHSKMVNND